MNQQEFKEILESIEVGLYDKWEVNLMNKKKTLPFVFPLVKEVQNFLDVTNLTSYISIAFAWAYSPEDYAFWNNVDNLYKYKLAERGLI